MRKTFREMFGELSPWGRFWLYLGIASLVAAALMSFDFGYSISLKHAAFLACLTFVTAFLPEAAYTQWESGRRGVGIVLALLCAPLLLVEFYSHAGYTAGLRGQNVSEARVQNTKYDNAQEATKEDKTNLEMWKAQLAKLIEENAWTATVKADALRDELATLKERMAAEEKGQRGRKAGRGREFEALQNKANAVTDRIAKAELREGLTKRIEATQRILDKKREVASATEYKSSAVEHQKASLARAVSYFRFGQVKPSEYVQEGADHSVNLAMAMVGTGLPALALFIAGLYRRRETYTPSLASLTPRYPATEAPATYHTAPAHQPAPVVINAVQPQRVDTSGLARRISRELGSIPLKRATA